MTTDTSINRRLPDDCFLAYVISHEAWYANVIDGREILISAESRGGGVAWELKAEEVNVGGKPTVRLSIFSDAFDAFVQVPEMFQAIAEQGRFQRLEDLAAVLDRLGAQDVTKRTEPGRRS